jgi:hypothetical protein
MSVRLKPLTAVAAAVLLCVLPTTSLAQTDDAETIRQLRAELALVRMKLETAERKLEAAEAGAVPAAPAPRVRPITSLSEIIERFPEEALPGRDGVWQQSKAAAADQRLKFAVWGTPFRDQLRLHSVNVQENPAVRTDPSASPWKATLQFEKSSFEMGDKTISESVASVEIFADERKVARLRRLSEGDRVRVSGEMVSAQPNVFSLTNSQKANYLIQLRNVEIPGMLP